MQVFVIPLTEWCVLDKLSSYLNIVRLNIPVAVIEQFTEYFCLEKMIKRKENEELYLSANHARQVWLNTY